LKVIKYLIFLFISSYSFLIVAANDSDICSICYDKKVTKVLPCAHKMCSSCASSSLAVKRECPFCRYKLSSRECPLEIRGNNNETRESRSRRPFRRATLRENSEQELKRYYNSIARGDLQEVRNLRGNYSIDVKDREGNAPVHIAAKNGKVRMLRMLKKHKANFNAVNKCGQSPLHVAFKYKKYSAVSYLLRKKVNTTSRDMWGKKYDE
jgi:hypothetical protein